MYRMIYFALLKPKLHNFTILMAAILKIVDFSKGYMVPRWHHLLMSSLGIKEWLSVKTWWACCFLSFLKFSRTISVFGVICCNCHQRFTSGCIYKSTSIFLEVSQKPPRALRMTKFMFCVARIWKPHNTHRPYEAWSYHTHGVIRHYPPFPQF